MLGVSAVAIRPEHRAGGAGSALMKDALREARATRMPLSALYPATQPVYRRLGYELAGARTLYRVPSAALALKSRPLSMRPIGVPDLARLRSTYLAFARRSAGLLDRTEWSWARVLSGHESTVHAYVAERGSNIEGYVVFVQKPLAAMGYEIIVKDVVALTRDAALSLLSFLGDHRSMAPDISFFGAPADPLLMLLPEQAWKTERRWDWMLRICDVAAALEARGFPPGLTAQLQLEVLDDTLPENAGRWRIAIGGGHAEVTRGGRGRVRLDIRGLASLYSGRCSAHELVRAGLASGPDADLEALSAAFAGPAPWMPDMF
jgi:predicted acetyltransferase